MNNTIEFVVKMKNMMSGELGKLSSTAQSSFHKMSQFAQGVGDKNKVLGMSYNELSKQIANIENTIKNSTIPSQIAFAKRELADLQKQAAKHQGNTDGSIDTKKSGIGIGGIAIGSMLGGAALKAGSMIVGAVGSGVSEMINQSMQKEQAITGLTTFLGKQGATEAYKNIRQDANVTPYDTASLLEVNRSLISAGANAKDARRDTMNLANAVSAVGGGNDVLSRMASNMQQIKTVGKATAMDIRQFGIAGINIYEMLSRSTGKNIEEVKKMDVTYDDLAKSLAMANSKGGIYEGAMAAQSQTISGKWSTVKDNFMTAASDIGDAFSPVIHKLLDLGIQFASSIGPALEQAQPYIDMISNGIGKTVDYIMSIVNGTSDWSGWVAIIQDNFIMIWGHVLAIGKKLWQFVASIIEFVKHSEILKDVFRFISWIVDKIGGVISWLLDSILWLWEKVLKPILEALDAVYKWVKGTDDVKITATKKIVSPKQPKDDPKNSPIANASNLISSNNESGKKAGDTVTGGGPKTINITVGKFFDNIQFTTMNGKESAQELENMVLECFSRVVYNGAKMV
jgi:tape measure domain-containing protein